jgi:hypothetical protein
MGGQSPCKLTIVVPHANFIIRVNWTDIIFNLLKKEVATVRDDGVLVRKEVATVLNEAFRVNLKTLKCTCSLRNVI